MNPKCPWCGEERKIYKNPFHDLWRIGCCKNKQCPSVKEEPSYELALAAASKRFMPNRSVEEINEYESYCSILWVTEYKKFQADDKDIVRGYQFASYLDAIHETRIADFIYGVSE